MHTHTHISLKSVQHPHLYQEHRNRCQLCMCWCVSSVACMEQECNVCVRVCKMVFSVRVLQNTHRFQRNVTTGDNTWAVSGQPGLFAVTKLRWRDWGNVWCHSDSKFLAVHVDMDLGPCPVSVSVHHFNKRHMI